MAAMDFNLLVTLDVLLTEGSVSLAAKRLRLSPSAMSRALARLRKATGDPLLVRAGRSLVPTPRALELREQARKLVQEVERVLSPAPALQLKHLTRTFTLRTREGFVDNFGPELLKRLRRDAPGVRLYFLQKSDKDYRGLHEGTVDLETGALGASTPAVLCRQTLFNDQFVGVVRKGHELAKEPVTAYRYASSAHVAIARRVGEKGPIDHALHALELERTIATSVDNFATALALARRDDLVATVPERHTEKLRVGMYTFPLPVVVPEITVSMLWHPRVDGDPAHRWLRQCVAEVCGAG